MEMDLQRLDAEVADFLSKRFNCRINGLSVSQSQEVLELQLPSTQDRWRAERSGHVFSLRVRARWTYSIAGSCYTQGTPSEKAVLLQYVFLDANCQIIPGNHGFAAFSDASGNYSYVKGNLKGAESQFSIVAPQDAHYLLLGFRSWDAACQPELSTKWILRDTGAYVSVDDYGDFLATFLGHARESASDTVAFLFASTKFIGHSHRGNRSMRFAYLMAQRGIPVLFNYYRWSTNSDMVAYEGGNLFQCPIDVTISKMVDIASHDYGAKKKLLLLSFPNIDAVKYIGLFKKYGWTVIYECRDDWEEFWLAGAGKWYHPLFERYVVANAHAVCTVSCTLRDKMGAWRLEGQSRPVVIPNGLEPSFLSRPTREFSCDPKRATGGTVIGYHGHLTAKWFDWKLLMDTAKARPEWRFEIIGFDGPDDIDPPGNMLLLGPKSHEEINEIAAGWTVGIIPFMPGRLAEGVDPIKVYEYLAMALPVVSVNMPQIHQYPYTFCYTHRDQFPDLLEKASSIRPDVGVLDEFLSTRTWEDRIDETLTLMESVLEGVTK